MNQSSPYCPSCQCPNCQQIRSVQQRRCPSCQQPLSNSNSENQYQGQYQGQNAGQGGQGGQSAEYCVGCWRNLSQEAHAGYCRYRP